MEKNTIRLNESQLHNLIKESVEKILNEIGETKKGQELLGRLGARKYFEISPEERASFFGKTAPVDTNGTRVSVDIDKYANLKRDEMGDKGLNKDQRRPIGLLRAYMNGAKKEFNKEKNTENSMNLNFKT